MISVRLSVACSTVWPPERKTTPARSAGTCSLRTLAVAWPTLAGVDCLSYCLPARTMLTLRIQARKFTPVSVRDLKSWSRILAVASADLSMS